MTAGVVWRPQAVEELLAAIAWYDKQQTGLGEQFASACRATLDLLRARPDLFAPVHGPIRRVLLRRFPYAIMYLAEGTDLVVLAVMHERRDPRSWRRRR